LSFQEAWDLEEVDPLFNVPACVLFAQRQPDAKTSYPIKAQKVKGKLARRNASLEESKKHLHTEDIELHLHQRGKRSYWSPDKAITTQKASFYKEPFLPRGNYRPPFNVVRRD
jgi:hypothetical protein